MGAVGGNRHTHRVLSGGESLGSPILGALGAGEVSLGSCQFFWVTIFGTPREGFVDFWCIGYTGGAKGEMEKWPVHDVKDEVSGDGEDDLVCVRSRSWSVAFPTSHSYPRSVVQAYPPLFPPRRK